MQKKKKSIEMANKQELARHWSFFFVVLFVSAERSHPF
jgi:hypothetical protein